ncbi:hypothetical protein P8A18_13565 [Streptomyces castrisilvae]|uniref:Flp pilus assembly protein RcpC/CpaB domain-containing protein n=1 Tax=Streptomyces castrisilvae TaxID=3033811 RepID=A0ABY9HIN7_9ACTN|nr:hypothetical protein [Streptomyces sp. Mut1]WLQ34401.1 hypothetical protein P8A18_13565 [Streptomyces sp. Mut1]
MSGSPFSSLPGPTASVAGAPPGPLPAPPPCGVPAFPPLRVRGGSGHRLRRAVWRQRRSMAAGLALTAAALAVSGFGGGGGGQGADAAPGRASPPVRLVSAPVRIADAATVRLLRPGDRVDVVASEGAGTKARVLAEGARVEQVPAVSAEGASGAGALIVLAVPRTTAADLAGAGISGGFAVILC